MQIMGHMYVNAKIILLKLFQNSREEGIKESSGGGEFRYDIFDLS
jgi:hypothetical protein